jgi:hypothetical protein
MGDRSRLVLAARRRITLAARRQGQRGDELGDCDPTKASQAVDGTVHVTARRLPVRSRPTLQLSRDTRDM